MVLNTQVTHGLAILNFFVVLSHIFSGIFSRLNANGYASYRIKTGTDRKYALIASLSHKVLNLSLTRPYGT